MSRAQAHVTVVEAAIGVLLLTSVTLGFALGTPGEAGHARKVQLDTYASDAATLLTNEPPRHGEQTRLAEVTASTTAFERERDALTERLDRILPPNVMFRVETRYGSAGYPQPSGVQTGEATVLTTNGEVTIRVWYA